MLSVSDGVTDDVLEEYLENTAGLLVDVAAYFKSLLWVICA
jgi:hypothetical protein